jgi:hypothetical protein
MIIGINHWERSMFRGGECPAAPLSAFRWALFDSCGLTPGRRARIRSAINAMSYDLLAGHGTIP